MFKQRFDLEKANDFNYVYDAVGMMLERANATLFLLAESDKSNFEGKVIDGAIYGVIQELDDIREAINAHRQLLNQQSILNESS